MAIYENIRYCIKVNFRNMVINFECLRKKCVEKKERKLVSTQLFYEETHFNVVLHDRGQQY